jgi:nickel transport system ATP-binding protein
LIEAENSILEVKNLQIGLKNHQRILVKDLSFSLTKGRVLGLIGESGCGKSLTCLSILGLLPANVRRTGGGIRIQGRSVNEFSPSELRMIRGRSVAMILQNPMSCFDPVFTIRYHFRETMSSHKFDRSGIDLEQVDEALRSVGFPDPRTILDLYPFQMSGGMLQRVMVAVALLMGAPLLIADEPTTDLDVVSQANILTMIESVKKKQNVGILLVTHDLSVIARLADDVAVMRQGEIVERGPVRELFVDPRHPYTRALLQAHFSLYGQHGSLKGQKMKIGAECAPLGFSG